MARLLAIAAAIVTLLCFAAACRSDGRSDPAVEAYFAELNAIATDTGPAAEAFFADVADATPLPENAPADERLAHGRQIYEELLSLQQEFISRMQDVDPPPRLDDAHEAYLGVAEVSAAWLEGFLESDEFDDYILGVDAGTSIVDIALGEYGLDADLLQRAMEACAELALVAADHNIPFGVECLTEGE